MDEHIEVEEQSDVNIPEQSLLDKEKKYERL